MSSATLSTSQSRTLVAQLRRSQVYRDYERAFRDTTGLPITLRPIEGLDLPHHGDPMESAFCALMSRSNHSCAACLQLQQRVQQEAQFGSRTLKCFAGFSDSAVPVRVGDNLIGYLQTGQVLLAAPNEVELGKAASELKQLGGMTDNTELRVAYYKSRVLTPKQYESIVRLLSIFAQHLSAMSNQLLVQAATAESPAVAKARAFIAAHYAEELSLGEIARQVNMSAFYFCKIFKKQTGVTFTIYLARVRVEQVKQLLLDRNMRVSEAAYEAGFQSLSQFNRVFRRLAGESPSDYRDQLHGNAAG